MEPQRGLTVPDDEARAPDEELRLGAPLEVRRDRQPRLARASVMIPSIIGPRRITHALAPRLLFTKEEFLPRIENVWWAGREIGAAQQRHGGLERVGELVAE